MTPSKPPDDAVDPKRLADAPNTPEELREVLRAARSDEPSDAALAALAARLGPLLPTPAPPPPGGPSGAPPPVASPVAAGIASGKLLLGVLVAMVGAGGAGVWWATQGGGPGNVSVPPPPALVAAEAPPADPAAQATPAAPSGAGNPDETVAQATSGAKGVPIAGTGPVAGTGPAPVEAAPGTPPPADDLEAELELLREAQGALATDPTASLRAAEAHASRFPQGALAQEREVAAIQALVALGRREEARRRADAFEAAWPTSAHLRRVHVILGD